LSLQEKSLRPARRRWGTAAKTGS